MLSLCKKRNCICLQSVILGRFQGKWWKNNLAETLQKERKLVILQTI
jgi:hypothetical protein